jgi:hypothetical protein
MASEEALKCGNGKCTTLFNIAVVKFMPQLRTVYEDRRDIFFADFAHYLRGLCVKYFDIVTYTHINLFDHLKIKNFNLTWKTKNRT